MTCPNAWTHDVTIMLGIRPERPCTACAVRYRRWICESHRKLEQQSLQQCLVDFYSKISAEATITLQSRCYVFSSRFEDVEDEIGHEGTNYRNRRCCPPCRGERIVHVRSFITAARADLLDFLCAGGKEGKYYPTCCATTQALVVLVVVVFVHQHVVKLWLLVPRVTCEFSSFSVCSCFVGAGRGEIRSRMWFWSPSTRAP